MKVIPVSVDGVVTPEFPESRVDKGQASALNVRFFPELMLVNPKTKRTLPVSHGIVTEDEISRQLYMVATDFKGTEE